jgi:hypothetical protein
VSLLLIYGMYTHEGKLLHFELLQHLLVCSLNVQDVATVLAVVLGRNPQKVNL